MTVRNHLEAAHALASRQFPEIHRQWITLSSRLGQLLPHSLLMVEVQRCGQIDRLVRAMEAEASGAMRRGEDLGFGFDVQSSLSEIWISKAYSILFILSNRRITRDQELFNSLLNDLRLLRVPLEKFEIASDRDLPAGGLVMQAVGDGLPTQTVYDPNDQRRGHIMPAGVDAQSGALVWCAVDVGGIQQRWVNRQDLSDRMLSLIQAT